MDLYRKPGLGGGGFNLAVGKPAVHTHGAGKCSACATTLAKCPGCHERTLHRVAGEYVCENRCNPRERISQQWKEEMRAALEAVR